MSTKISNWPAGTPMWVDLGVEDPGAARDFYAELFGWQFPPGPRRHPLAYLGGRAVAGIGPKQDQATDAAWTTFLATDDVDATARKITAAGGQVTAPPRQVADSGRSVLAADTAGAVFGLWQAGTHIGAERVNEHGALCWNELRTRDYRAARSFYSEVFHHAYQEVSAENYPYATFRRPLDGREVAGMLRSSRGDGPPDHWLAWFASDDVEGTARLAGELGSTFVAPLTESPLGRTAIVKAPQGEVFGIIDAPRTSEYFRQPPDRAPH